MDTITCPYCHTEVKISEVELEEGSCPECGTIVTANMYNGEDSYEENDDNYDDSEFEEDEIFEEETEDIDENDFEEDLEEK